MRFRGEWVKPKPHLLPEQIQFIEIRVQFKANLFFFLVHISRTIVRACDRIPVVSTRQFTAIVTAAVHNVRTDRFSCQLRPAARTFQALRIPGTRKRRVKRTSVRLKNSSSTSLPWWARCCAFLSCARRLDCQTFLQRNAFRWSCVREHMSWVKPRRSHGHPSIKRSFTPRMKRFTLIPPLTFSQATGGCKRGQFGSGFN